MGTNYYVEAPNTPWGETQRLHVGKSSAGWVFAFQVHNLDEVQLRTTEDWRKFLDGMVEHGPCRLLDEYGHEHTVEEFWEWVEKKKGLSRGDYGGTYDDEGNDMCPYEFS